MALSSVAHGESCDWLIHSLLPYWSRNPTPDQPQFQTLEAPANDADFLLKLVATKPRLFKWCHLSYFIFSKLLLLSFQSWSFVYIVVIVINRKIDIVVVVLDCIRLYLIKWPLILKYTTVFAGCVVLPLASKISGIYLLNYFFF